MNFTVKNQKKKRVLRNCREHKRRCLQLRTSRNELKTRTVATQHHFRGKHIFQHGRRGGYGGCRQY